MSRMLEDYDHLLNLDPISAYEIQPLSACEGHLLPGLRDRESLNGEWHFAADVYNTFLRKKYYLEPQKDEQGRDLPVDYDFDRWETVHVPSNWNCQKEKYWLYEGTGIYTRRFAYAEENPEERVFLRIGAANYACRIWLNKQLIARHTGGFTPFCVELTGKLNAENRLILEVDAQRRLEQVPSVNCDWFNYGGVFRDVELFRVPKVWIRDTWVALDAEANALNAQVRLDGAPAGSAVTVEISELGIAQTLRTDENGVARGRMDAAVQLWSPERPRLYRVRVSTSCDSWSDDIGFRRIETRGRDLYLNGEKLFLRGVCCHEEAQGRGRALTEEDAVQMLTQARELGCNVIRLSHYPHHERVAKLADRMGMMLWEEIPVYWALCFDKQATRECAQNQMRELVLRDRNRASVILWGIGNENPDTQPRLDFMKSLAEICKELDPTRLTTAACLVDIDSMRVCDRLCSQIDVVSINEYYGWYYRDYRGIADILENTRLDRPLMISETGAEALAGHHGTQEELFTEEHQAKMLKMQTCLTDGKITGLFPWILYDFLSPVRLNAWQNGFNRKGLMDEGKREKKMAWQVLSDYYQSQKGK